FTAFDDLKKNYMSKLTGKKAMKIKVSKGAKEASKIKDVTTIPKIREKHIQEIEIIPVIEGFSYVRITFDNISSDYFYEIIEPSLKEEEEDVLEVLKEILVDSLELLEDATDEEKEDYLRKGVDSLLSDMGVSLNPLSKERVLYYIIRDFVRYGPIDVPMIEGGVEDLSCDGVDVPFYIYTRQYGSIQSNLKFSDEVELDAFVVWLAQRCGKHISVAEPMLDATVPDGSRLNATLGTHVTKRGSSFTIRRFKEDPFTPLDLVRFKTMSPDMMAYIWLCIENGKSILVCGGTASGKTTTLNAVLIFIPAQMKVVSIEDTRELNLPHENWVPLLTRSGFGGKDATGKSAGEIDMFDLLMAALRQRPQYMMIGEVRGSEANVVFQAMATGKSAYTTFHADNVQAMVNRMEQPPIEIPRALLTALDLVLMQAQVKVGSGMTRRVKSLTEIFGMDPDSGDLITNKVYTWNPADDTFNYSGHSYIYEAIAESKNWTAREMLREVKRRIDLLEYMKRIGIKTNRELATIISAYYTNPDETMKDVRRVLDGED
ncbi:MAG: type II/IV secretion system ATPase subunit, partial [Thermoplasmata archaeon]|nr:type II/IV secretion system ATPase subunit [Thermoplasmata archaeon]